MSRQIRKVTPNYKHPERWDGRYVPLLDNFSDDRKDYKQYVKEHGEHDAMNEFGGGPNPSDYMLPNTRPEERTWLQVFETVSEGTPASPPFSTKGELIDYLCTEGGLFHREYPQLYPVLSRKAAEKFVKISYVPSGIITSNVFKTGMQALEDDD